ncbi:MAG TPA: hypothetical protein VM103_00765 [Candidatus Paceibacterota bacterium]|nr:hypothetical protein [Candidatus Paceibacterota bacterium]
MNKTLLIGAGLVVLGIVAGMFYMKNVSQISVPTTVSQTKVEQPDPSALLKFYKQEDLAEFRDAELGISFQYPREWGEVQDPGDHVGIQGTKRSVSFSGAPTEGLFLVAKSKDFCEGGTDSPTAFIGRGYTVENGTYFIPVFGEDCKSRESRQVTDSDHPEKVPTLAGDVLMRSFQEPYGSEGDMRLYADMNLSGKGFTGLGIYNGWSARITDETIPKTSYVDDKGEVVTNDRTRPNPISFEKQHAVFKAVLQTIKPTE